MEFDELKERYTELRNRCLGLHRNEFRRRADWNILFGNSKDLEMANQVLTHVFKEDEEEFNAEFPPIE